MAFRSYRHKDPAPRRSLAGIVLLLGLLLLNPGAANAAALAQTQLQQHTVMADGHPLAVWEKSPANPRAQLLLLHGRTWSSRPDFDLLVAGEDLSFMNSLNALGYAVFALDARGYGATPRDASGWLTPNRAAEDAAIVLHWLKARSPLPLHLFGWSYGSMVSQLVVQRAPARVASVTLFGYPFDPSRHVAAADFTYPAQPPAITNTAANAASDFIVPGSISQQAIDAYVQAALAADPVRVDFKNLHEWAELDASSINTPTLLLEGEFDPLAPAANLSAVFSAIQHPQKWWIVLPGGDHAALLEKPRKTMLVVMDGFMRTVDGL
jgi:pimeloyl-ACP methyl ester carboxylesterase